MAASVKKQVFCVIAIVILALLLWGVLNVWSEYQKSQSEDPLVWESAITELEQQKPTHNAPVVFVGSSSIRMWSTLAEDMQPIPVIRNGFGGAKLGDVVHFSKRLVSAFSPTAVVVFAGSNDIDPGKVKSPKQLLASFQRFVDSVREVQKDLPIFYIAITPSILRWEIWSDARAANQAIESWIETTPELFYIDTSLHLLGDDGMPNEDFYLFDGLHLNAQGYERWTNAIRPVLLRHPKIADRVSEL